MRRTPITVFVFASSCLLAAPALAYVDVELDGGRHIVGDSYQSDGEKVTVFRPSGALDVPRNSVRSIQQLPGALPNANDAGASASSGPSSGGSGRATASIKDPGQRDRDLAYQLLDIRMQRLTAQQRGDDAAMKKLDAQIKTLQGERNSLAKKHDGSDEEKSD